MNESIRLQTTDDKEIAKTLSAISDRVGQGSCRRLLAVVMEGDSSAYFDSGGGSGDAATIGSLIILVNRMASLGWEE